jgi:hypothetical protein
LHPGHGLNLQHPDKLVVLAELDNFDNSEPTAPAKEQLLADLR